MNQPHQRPLLYLITNRQAFRRSEDQIEMIGRAAKAGCHLIQIREKDLSANALGDFVRKAIAAARPYGSRILVNDRFDVAMAADADGVHLRSNSLPASEIRRVLAGKGPVDFLIGASTHSLDEVQTAELEGADFVVYGPVSDTPSKREYGPPAGIDKLAQVCKATKIPVLALGGINLANYREALQCGAAGIAAIRLFTDPNEIENIIHTILSANPSQW